MLMCVISREDTVSVVKNYTYDDGCEPCGTDIFNREPFVVMFSSRNSGMSWIIAGLEYMGLA